MSKRLINKINMLEQIRESAREQQILLVYKAKQTGEWKEHPARPETLYSWLKLANLKASAVSEIYLVGAIVMPFCAKHNINLEGVKYSYIIEASAVLRQYIKAEQVDKAREVLKVCRNARTRAEVRQIFRNRRKYWAEHYVVGNTIIVQVKDDAHTAKVVDRIARFSEAISTRGVELPDYLEAEA